MFTRDNDILHENDYKAFEIYKASKELPDDQRIDQEDIAFKMSSELESLVLNL